MNTPAGLLYLSHRHCPQSSPLPPPGTHSRTPGWQVWSHSPKHSVVTQQGPFFRACDSLSCKMYHTLISPEIKCSLITIWLQSPKPSRSFHWSGLDVPFQDVDSPSQVIPRFCTAGILGVLFVSLFILLNTSAFFGFICKIVFLLRFNYLHPTHPSSKLQFKNILLFVYFTAWVLVAALGILCLCWGLSDLVPWPGMELSSPALGSWNLSHWTTKEVPQAAFKLTFPLWNLPWIASNPWLDVISPSPLPCDTT